MIEQLWKTCGENPKLLIVLLGFSLWDGKLVKNCKVYERMAETFVG
jgi:hypothetical protein